MVCSNVKSVGSSDRDMFSSNMPVRIAPYSVDEEETYMSLVSILGICDWWTLVIGLGADSHSLPSLPSLPASPASPRNPRCSSKSRPSLYKTAQMNFMRGLQDTSSAHAKISDQEIQLRLPLSLPSPQSLRTMMIDDHARLDHDSLLYSRCIGTNI